MIATTRGALLRGSAIDALGDEVDAAEAVATPAVDQANGRTLDDFPISIIETKRSEFDQASNAWRTVRYYAGRVPPYVMAIAGDRIRDNRTGAIFTIGEVEAMARGLSGRKTTTISMRRMAP